MTACCVSLASAVVAEAGPAQPWHVDLPNGIEATIYTPDYIRETMLDEVGEETVFQVEDVRYRMITDVDDPMVTNRGSGRFHPMSPEMVVEALEEIRLEDAGLKVRIFVLPFPRREIPESSARGNLIFLAPGVESVSRFAVHFTVAHEVGHIYQYRYLPDHDVYGWARYSQMRGIENRSTYHAHAAHRNRPHEIFAEDFRFLFGSETSNYSGSIENHSLALPSEVEGLGDYLLSLSMPPSLAAVRMIPTPNPFNPSTELHLEFDQAPDRHDVLVRVFDAQGRVVRRLFHGRSSSNIMMLHWDGRSADGSPVSSGVYFARLDYAGRQYSTKLMLVK